MFNEDKAEFYRCLSLAMAAKGNDDLPKDLVIYWFDLFNQYSIDSFKSALNRAVTETKGRLTPNSVMQFLPCPLGHPTVEEAWNAAPKTERESAYVTDEIMAAISAADDSIARGDMVAARMCFREVYERNINEARIMNKPARFWLTEGVGFSEDEKQENRKKALTGAHAKGWISDNVYKTKIKSLPNFGGNVARLEDFSKGLEQRKLVASKQIFKIKAMLNGGGDEK
jgi:hypothetical protein